MTNTNRRLKVHPNERVRKPRRERPEWLDGPVKKSILRVKPKSGFRDSYILRFPFGHGVVLDGGGSNADTETVLDEIVKRFNAYDDLATEIGDLHQQRDALVDASKALKDIIASISVFMEDGDPCPFCGQEDEHYANPPEPQCPCLDAQAALDRVRVGEGGE